MRRTIGPGSRVVSVLSILGIAVVSLTGCFRVSEPIVGQEILTVPSESINLGRAATENKNRYVMDSFQGHISVWDDTFGLVTANELFLPGGSATLIISAAEDSAQLRAASIAVSQRAPMVVYNDEIREGIVSLMVALGVRRVLLVGDVPVAQIAGSTTITKDSGSTPALGKITAFQFHSKVVGQPDGMVAAVAALNPDEKTELKAAWEPLKRNENAHPDPIPAQSRRDGGMAPVIIATPRSSVAAVSNATAWGGEVWVMPTGDPRDSIQQLAMVAGLDQGPLVALGPDFGNARILSARIQQGMKEVAFGDLTNRR